MHGGDEMSMEKKEAEHGEDEISGILHKLDRDELVELLSTGKSGSELNSFLLEVF